MKRIYLLFPILATLGVLPLFLRSILKPGWILTPEIALYFVTSLPQPQAPSTYLIHTLANHTHLFTFFAIFILLMMLLLALQYSIIISFSKSQPIAALSSIVLAISPFAVSALSQDPQLIISLVLLLGVIQSLQKGWVNTGIILLALTLILPPIHTMAISLLALGYTLTLSKIKWNSMAAAGIIFVCSILTMLLFGQIPKLNTNVFFWLFSEWGIVGGVTFITLALSVATFVLNWKRMNKQALMVLALLLVACLFFTEITFLFWPLLAYASGWMLHVLYHYEWQTISFKYVAVGIIAIGLLWSTVVVVITTVGGTPDIQDTGAYIFLKDLPSGKILVPADISQSIATQTNLSTLPASSLHTQEVVNASALYSNLRLEEINAAFLDKNITYIWIPQNDFNLDLRYTLNIERAFEKIYQDNENSIYKFRFRNDSGTILLQ